jgi:hypothetical protein
MPVPFSSVSQLFGFIEQPGAQLRRHGTEMVQNWTGDDDSAQPWRGDHQPLASFAAL